MARSIRLIAVAVVAVLALAMPAFAVQAKAAKAKTTTTTISGTLQRVDGQTLTVQTPTGSETVMLAPNAQIRRAGKTLSASDLGGESGSRVTVRYMENNGQKMAQSVTLAAAPKTAAKVAKK
jgi:Tfp pilus assembly protein PilE